MSLNESQLINHHVYSPHSRHQHTTDTPTHNHTLPHTHKHHTHTHTTHPHRREQAELEEAAKLKAAQMLTKSTNNPSSVNTQRLESELSAQRHSKISNQNSFMFSYFNYVAPPKVKRDKKVRGRAARSKT